MEKKGGNIGGKKSGTFDVGFGIGLSPLLWLAVAVDVPVGRKVQVAILDPLYCERMARF
jgi:hypothetical protein